MKKSPLQTLPVSALEVNKGQIEGLPKNPRLIRDERFKKLRKSIEDAPEMLDMRSLIVVRHGQKYVTICGNMRLRACMDLGYKELPCYVLPEDTPPEKLREYTVKDNVSFGETDWDILANEWDTAELLDFGMELPEYKTGPEDELDSVEEDDFTEEDAEQAETRVRAGDIWQLGDHRLMCGDSTNEESVMRLMDGQTADLCVTDPPYNVNYEEKAESQDSKSKTRQTSRIANDDMGDQDFYTFLLAAYNCMETAMREGAALYVFHAPTTAHSFIVSMLDAGLKLAQNLAWVKNTFVFGRQDYQWRHEGILYGWKEGSAHYFINDRSQDTVLQEDDIDIDAMKKADLVAYVKRMREKYGEYTTVLCEDKPLRSDLHPTAKPVRLIGRLMANSSKKGWNVLDLFGGGGQHTNRSRATEPQVLHDGARPALLRRHHSTMGETHWAEGSQSIIKITTPYSDESNQGKERRHALRTAEGRPSTTKRELQGHCRQGLTTRQHWQGERQEIARRSVPFETTKSSERWRW